MNRSSDTTFSRSADRDSGGVPGAEASTEPGVERSTEPGVGPRVKPAAEPGAEPSSSTASGSGASSGPHPGFAAASGVISGSVFCADPALAEENPAEALPEGFAGRLSLRGPESLGYEETVSALQRLGMLISWAQAQQARVAARLEVLFARDIADASGREEPALALSLAAAEASAVLNIPHMTAMQLISESTRLCTDAPETLARLSEGKIALQHARIILEETHNLPTNIPEPTGLNADAGAGAAAAAGPSAADPADDLPAADSGQLDLGLGAEDGSSMDDGTAGTGSGQGTQPDSPDAVQNGGKGTDSHADTDNEPEVLSVRGAFERDLLAAAEGRTAAGFGRRARRLRESRFPDLIPVRHRQAKDKRRVTFQPLPDGMSCLSAIIAAEKGQAMFAALTGAAKAGKRAGDPRTMDQLRADILTELLLEGDPADINTPDPKTESESETGTGTGTMPGSPADTSTGTRARRTHASPVPGPGTDTDTHVGTGIGSDSGTDPRSGSGFGSGTGPRSGSDSDSDSDSDRVNPTDTPAATHNGANRKEKRPRRAQRHRNQNRSKVRTEVMVLINADTLAGLDENPAELNGYGPISAETARAMILDALHWTPLLQNPDTGEILNIGRTRRIPSGLKRWLQARDGTCRFPGCSVNVTHAEIDHTTPFSHGGPTDHTNLEHLCPKHHRFKTLGHWKARQPEAGTIQWNSPTGRTYTTNPALDYTSQRTNPRIQKAAQTGVTTAGDSDMGRWYGFGDSSTGDSSDGSATAVRDGVTGTPPNEPPPF